MKTQRELSFIVLEPLDTTGLTALGMYVAPSRLEKAVDEKKEVLVRWWGKNPAA